MQVSYHSALTKIQKLQNFKKKKKLFFLYWPVLPEIGRYMAGIFSGMKHRGYMYRFACQYGI